MKTKYQIFVSSTYDDLKEERNQAIKGILEMGHIPVGMEMFSAGDDEQWELIKSQINDCDYYVVIVAFRYGSMDGGTSYTEKEYDYAVTIGIPTLGFVIYEGANWNAAKIDKDSEKIEKLNMFKEKIKRKIISQWENKTDLYGKIPIALMKQFTTNPGVGWVRANQYSGPEILNEISRLSKENSELRKSIEEFDFSSNQEVKERYNRVLNIIKTNKKTISFHYKNGTKWQDHTEFPLFQIFVLIAPKLMIESSVKYCSHYVGMMLRPSRRKILRDPWGTPANSMRQILADLNVLDLVIPSIKKHKIDDENEYWTITEFGKDIYKMVRQEILEENLSLDSNIDLDESKPEKE
jgi:hypothetical protein